MRSNRTLTLAMHGTSRGFGFVVFEGPSTLYDWGTVVARGDKNAVCLRKLEAMLDRYAPEAMILEAWEKGSSLRSERIARLYSAAERMAESKGIAIYIYKFRDVQACFAVAGVRPRQEIAEAVSERVEALRHRVPKPRKPWDSEHRRMAVFCAAALVHAHFHM